MFTGFVGLMVSKSALLIVTVSAHTVPAVSRATAATVKRTRSLLAILGVPFCSVLTGSDPSLNPRVLGEEKAVPNDE